MLTKSNCLFLLVFYGSIGCLLSGCQEEPAKSKQITQNLIVPERTSPIYLTDRVLLAGQELSLWFNTGSCQLRTKHPKLTLEPTWLKVKAPCYFVQSPGTNTVQVYQRDKISRVLAVLGTPDDKEPSAKRCGTEVEGVVLDANGKVRVSNGLLSGKHFCADQGLTNTDYELFAQD